MSTSIHLTVRRLRDPRDLLRLRARHRLGPEALHEGQRATSSSPGRSIPAWVTGLAFLSANLGAQEVIGMAASGAKYGIMTSHFYWVGAIPAMVFLGDLHDAVLLRLEGALGAGVPQAALRRKDARLQRHLLRGHDGLLLRHLACTRWPGCCETLAGLELLDLHRRLGGHRAGLHLPRRTDLGDLQRGAAVLHDRARASRRWSSSA